MTFPVNASQPRSLRTHLGPRGALVPIRLWLVLISFTALSAQEFAPRPYTARQIRAAYPTGTVLTYLHWSPTTVKRTRSQVLNCGAERVEFEDYTLDESGKPGGQPTRWSASWLELRNHATFPGSTTTIRDERVKVGAGTFDCWHYIVKTDQGERHFYFAKEKAGAPIRFETWKEGVVVSKTTLEEATIPGHSLQDPVEEP